MAAPDADGTRPSGEPSRVSESRPAKAPMTLDEAQAIVQQLDRGKLDLSLPGTQEIIAEAHRVRLKAELWGADSDDDRRRQVKGTVIVVCAFIVVTVVGLVAALAFTV